MVKDTKKKSTNGQIEELEVEIESNSVSDLDEKEKEIFLEIISGTKGRLQKMEIPDQSENADSNADLIGQFLNHLRDGSLDLLGKCVWVMRFYESWNQFSDKMLRNLECMVHCISIPISQKVGSEDISFLMGPLCNIIWGEKFINYVITDDSLAIT